MTNKITEGLTRQHVLSALADLGSGISHPFGPPTRYHLIHDGKRYAPKAVIGLASKHLTGHLPGPGDFSGGEAPGQANYVLRHLGFEVVEIAGLPLPSTSPAFPINEELLALAVEKNIRPTLIGDGHLFDPKEEGYHHQLVIKKAHPLLKTEALQNLSVDSLKKVIGASVNLLSQYETTWATGFIEQTDLNEMRSRLLDLLYGSDELESRIRRFAEWSVLREVSDKKKVGINGTGIGFLLAMADPVKYAFCKPTVYELAVKALIGEPAVEKDPVRRLVHATRLYEEALRILRDRHGLPFSDLMHSHIAFYLMAYPKSGRPGWADLKKQVPDPKPVPPRKIIPMPINLVLYGPPGTGKTYHTISHAVRICDGQENVPADRAALVQRFRWLQDQGRIGFVTFHQSYSYEDFVEGIRPVLKDEAEGGEAAADIQYECRPGIFKLMAQTAKGGSIRSRVRFEFDPAKTVVWKMSLGDTADPNEDQIYDQCIQGNFIEMGYGKGIDYSACKSRDDVERLLRDRNPDISSSAYEIRAMDVFKNQMKVGDLVVVSEGNWKFRAIGKITGDYKWTPDSKKQTRSVEWLFVAEESLPHDRIMNRIFSAATVYRLWSRVLKHEALQELLSATGPATSQNYVLIIDEINRGNIAKILGELITLLEPDKRLGALNELQVRLPYSREMFGVPGNLYVVGTMNTADRSIALLDAALRRRFQFIEMMPDYDVIRNEVGKINGVDVARLLSTINERIELLYDRDHQIGHAYLLNVGSLKDLRQAFTEKVIPLLQEYFYGDWAKVCIIMGCPFEMETGKQACSHPLISSKRLSVGSMAGIDLSDYQDKVRCEVNPAFVKASEAELADYFMGVIAVSGTATDTSEAE